MGGGLMPILESYTDFTVAEALEVLTDETDLIVLPELTVGDATRRLTYPGDLFPPIDYPDNPDIWTNFDSRPLTARPRVKSDLAIKQAATTVWPGYIRDATVVERWRGADKLSRMTMYFVRRFLEYFMNPPKSGFIIWEPRDLTDRKYKIIIEDFTVDGAAITQFASIPHYYNLTVGEIVFTFRLVEEI